MAVKAAAIITLDQQRYYIQRTKVSLSTRLTNQLRNCHGELIPVTAIPWHKSLFEQSDLARACHEYEEADDVWNTSFLAVVVLLQPAGVKTEVRSKTTLRLDNSKAGLPKGPLVIEKSTGRIYKVSKLVVDDHFAFISGVAPVSKPKASFQTLPDHDILEIALPSRLYFEKSKSKPLAGIRVAVKDTIALKGLRTGYGNKAWAETYTPEKFTAPCVQLLIDAGAIIVGKTVSSEFAEGVDPADWAEGICPYNPRGDGQQKPSSSSTGSASAMAAYEWLDIAYGTDTGGSIRHPAGVQGLFGQRPSHGSIDMTGVLGATSLFNTVGIFARSARLFTQVGGHLVDPSKTVEVRPEQRKYNLLCLIRAPQVNDRDPFHNNQLRWFPHPEADPASYSEAEKQLETVMSRIETELGCKRVTFNVDELWRATYPIGQSRSIDEATGFIYGVVTTASACENDIDRFVHDYAVANNGAKPSISKLVNDRFEYGRQCSDEQITAALEAIQAFKQWVLKYLFGSLDQDTTTILVFPQSWGRPDYRDESIVHDELFKEYFSIYSFAYLCGCPDYTIPIGEIPFQSPVTNTTEHLPVSLSLLGQPGTDLELFGIVDYLHAKGVVPDVKAGKRLYANQIEAA